MRIFPFQVQFHESDPDLSPYPAAWPDPNENLAQHPVMRKSAEKSILCSAHVGNLSQESTYHCQKAAKDYKQIDAILNIFINNTCSLIYIIPPASCLQLPLSQFWRSAYVN